jgi:hypothetical protein
VLACGLPGAACRWFVVVSFVSLSLLPVELSTMLIYRCRWTAKPEDRQTSDLPEKAGLGAERSESAGASILLIIICKQQVRQNSVSHFAAPEQQ